MWAAASGNHSIAQHCERRADDRAKCFQLQAFQRALRDVLHLTVTLTYIQERIFLIASTSTFCNPCFRDALAAYYCDQLHFFALVMKIVLFSKKKKIVQQLRSKKEKKKEENKTLNVEAKKKKPGP